MSIDRSGTFPLGERTVKRLGYGVMQLAGPGVFGPPKDHRSEEHTSELQSLVTISYAVFCLKKKK